ncbi:MAG: ABC transporter substrate-binding protein, partial [Thermoproteota archaeon]|nr:ABC transporter substrate-binding protein [Thermoproteota archaeon]
PDEYILLEKNPYWWGEKPNVPEIRIDVIYGESARILAMRDGVADTERYELWGADIETVKEAPELKVITGVVSQWDYVLGFNLTTLGLDDPIVREAMCYALNRTEIIEVARAGYGTATWTTIPEAFFPSYYSAEGRFPEQNLTYANQILNESGYLDTDGDWIRNFPTAPPAAPEIIIKSPKNKTYDTTDVELIFTINEATDWIGYSLDGAANITITGDTTLTDLSLGSHNIIVYANDTDGYMSSSDILYFTVEEAPPPEINWPLIVGVAVICIVVGVAAGYYWVTRKK